MKSTKFQYTLAFISGIVAYTAANFIASWLPLYKVLPYPNVTPSSPVWQWWTLDAVNYVGIFWQMALYGAAFGLFCLLVNQGKKLPASRVWLTAAAATVLVVVTVNLSIALQNYLDPHMWNEPIETILDIATYTLIGGWYVLGWYFVRR